MKRIRHPSVWRLSLVAITAVALGSAGVYTMGGFSATVDTNSASASSATIQLSLGDGTTTCYSTGSGGGGTVQSANTNTTCGATVFSNLDMVPGGSSSSSTITLKNVGNHAASTANLTIGTCSAAAASDDNKYVGADTTGFCGKVDVTIFNNTTGNCVYPAGTGACQALSSSYTLSSLASIGSISNPTMSALAANATASYTIVTELDSGADNSDQGLAATIPFTWSISQ